MRQLLALAVVLCSCLGTARAQLPASFAGDHALTELAGEIERFDRALTGGAAPTDNRPGALGALRDALAAHPPAPLGAREQGLVTQCASGNELARQTLVGHFVVIVATDAFAARAAENALVPTLDLACATLAHFWGVDPVARARNRFIIWPDPELATGHRGGGGDGLSLRIAIGRADADDVDVAEALVREMSRAFQHEHPARCFMRGGFLDGFAELSQVVVCDALASLGKPFEGRFEWYAAHLPEVARTRYLRTRLPIEEIVGGEPAAGLLMELVNTTLDSRRRPDWGPMRRFLHGPMREPAWVASYLWPAHFARAAIEAFGDDHARPILARYRFPLDPEALDEVERTISLKPHPSDAPRTAVVSWRVLGPIPTSREPATEWNPLDAENIAIDAAEERIATASSRALGQRWRSGVRCDANGMLHLRDDRAAGAEYFYAVADLPRGFTGPITLHVSSDDWIALYLDGALVHLHRGTRGCTPQYPDVAYALAREREGRLVALVINESATSSLSVAVSKGTPFETAYAPRLESDDRSVRLATVEYIGSRPFVTALVKPLLMPMLADADAEVRGAAAWAIAGIRNDVEIVDALVARIASENDPDVRGRILDAIGELTFRCPTDANVRELWADDRARFLATFAVEAESAVRLGASSTDEFGNDDGCYAGQCIGQRWGSEASDVFSVVVEATEHAGHVVRFRYARAPDGGRITLRLRRGPTVIVEDPVTLERARDASEWRWAEVKTPRLEPGRYYVELVGPGFPVVIDVVSIAPR